MSWCLGMSAGSHVRVCGAECAVQSVVPSTPSPRDKPSSRICCSRSRIPSVPPARQPCPVQPCKHSSHRHFRPSSSSSSPWPSPSFPQRRSWRLLCPGCLRRAASSPLCCWACRRCLPSPLLLPLPPSLRYGFGFISRMTKASKAPKASYFRNDCLLGLGRNAAGGAFGPFQEV
eukprot:COSAG06_NODE_3381_length_5427_cov_3.749812_9_plen_174_part_00